MISEQHKSAVNTSARVLNFRQIDKTKLPLVGGKGANLGELRRIDGIDVPDGFCITTYAYSEIIGSKPEVRLLLDKLAGLKAGDRTVIAGISTKIRNTIEELPFPESLKGEIHKLLEQSGDKDAYAIRSSATAEDLPTASFAGQQDTYLNIIGEDEVLKHISKCWASLFTERAVT